MGAVGVSGPGARRAIDVPTRKATAGTTLTTSSKKLVRIAWDVPMVV